MDNRNIGSVAVKTALYVRRASCIIQTEPGKETSSFKRNLQTHSLDAVISYATEVERFLSYD